MEALTAIKTRRSCRAFKPEKIHKSVLYKILDAARWAPSAGNLQSWEFVIVEEETAKRQLASAALGQEFVAGAPTVVVVCADTERSAVKYGSRGKFFYSLADACAATQNLLIAAAAMDVATCWVGAFDVNQVRDVLRIPEGIIPIVIVPLGRPAEEAHPSSRTSLGNIVHFETYGKFETIRTAEGDESLPAKGKAPKPGMFDAFLR